MAQGPGCNTDLGAALRSGGCPPAIAPRNWVRIDSLDASRAFPGAMAQVRWASLSAMIAGMYGYLKSIAIRGSVVFTTGAANAAVSAYQVRSVVNQIDLVDVGGSKYLAAADGRDLVDDTYYRHGRLPRALGGAIGLNLGALAGRTADISIEIPLVGRAVGQSPMEGLVSIAALQKHTAEAFQFFLNSAFKGAPAGITITGFQKPDGTPGLEVWGEPVYLPPAPGGLPPYIGAPWFLRNETLQGQEVLLGGQTFKTIYAHGRYYPEDAFNGLSTGQQMAGDIDGLTVEVGGQTYMSALRAIDIVEREGRLRDEGVTGFGDSADALGLTNLVLPVEAGVTRPDLYMLPWRPTEDAPAGPILVKMATQPASTLRVLRRSVGCVDRDRAERLLASMGCGCGVTVQKTADGSLLVAGKT